MGELLSGKRSGPDYVEEYAATRSTIPHDISVSVRLIQKVEQLIAFHPSRTGGRISFNANVFWIDTFGIMYVEWNVTGLSDAESKYFYEIVEDSRQTDLVGSVYEAGRKATFVLSRLVAVTDTMIDETVKHIKKEQTWQDFVLDAGKK